MNGQGWFGNHRTLGEQMLGLGPAISEAKGKRVLDAGAAEGLIALEFVKAGAKVDAFDNNRDYVYEGDRQARRHGGGAMRMRWADLNVALPEAYVPPYDIVLALAIIHKARDVGQATQLLAGACSGLLVVRLPRDSKGMIKAKFGDSRCDLAVEMPALGFKLERKERGPRGELVQYWRLT